MHWPTYYWTLCKNFGRECYRTWRQELAASVAVMVFVFVLTWDWREFRTALAATALTLGFFALWHLVCSPWMIHKKVIGESISDGGDIAGVFGLVLFVSMMIGAFELAVHLWNARPLGAIKISIPSADPEALHAEIQRLQGVIQEDDRNEHSRQRALVEPRRCWAFDVMSVNYPQNPERDTTSVAAVFCNKRTDVPVEVFAKFDGIFSEGSIARTGRTPLPLGTSQPPKNTDDFRMVISTPPIGAYEPVLLTVTAKQKLQVITGSLKQQ